MDKRLRIAGKVAEKLIRQVWLVEVNGRIRIRLGHVTGGKMIARVFMINDYIIEGS